MEISGLVKARLDALIMRVDQAEQSIQSVGLNARLHSRVGKTLLMRLGEVRSDLNVRRNQLTAEKVPATVWTAISNNSPLDRLFDECLTFIQAARNRGPDVPPDLCEITDLLFEELSANMSSIEWRSYSALSNEDSFDHSTDIIRLRYPLCDIWDLPVTAHEFGHFMSPRLMRKTGAGSSLVFQQYKNDFVERQVTDGNSWGQNGTDWRIYLDEIFADMFATYALGPAFASTCIDLRFDPLTAAMEVDGRHPAYSKRAYIILQTLQRMDNEPAQRNQMQGPIMALKNHWQILCNAVEVAAWPEEKDCRWLDVRIADIYDLLLSCEPQLRFATWDGAKKHQKRLLEPDAELTQPFAIADLLNAAWLLRFQPDRESDSINTNFRKLCQGKTQRYDR